MRLHLLSLLATAALVNFQFTGDDGCLVTHRALVSKIRIRQAAHSAACRRNSIYPARRIGLSVFMKSALASPVDAMSWPPVLFRMSLARVAHSELSQ